MIKGIIFDMDGVILDTEKLYVRFWREAALFYGYDMTVEFALSIRSMAAQYAQQRFISTFGDSCDYYMIKEKRKEMMNIYINENGIETKKYADVILRYLCNQGYKVALATATTIDRTQKYLKQSNLYDYFDVIICAQMVKNGKPEPDIYCEAAKRLGLLTSECIGVEDSPNGVLSAYRAGCEVVMIPDLDEPDDDIRKYINYVACDLSELMKYIKRA